MSFVRREPMLLANCRVNRFDTSKTARFHVFDPLMDRSDLFLSVLERPDRFAQQIVLGVVVASRHLFVNEMSEVGRE